MKEIIITASLIAFTLVNCICAGINISGFICKSNSPQIRNQIRLNLYEGGYLETSPDNILYKVRLPAYHDDLTGNEGSDRTKIVFVDHREYLVTESPEDIDLLIGDTTFYFTRHKTEKGVGMFSDVDSNEIEVSSL